MIKKRKEFINPITGEVTEIVNRNPKQRIAINRNSMDVGFSKDSCKRITTTFQYKSKKYFKDSYTNFIKNLEFPQISTGMNHYVRDIIVIDIDSCVDTNFNSNTNLKNLNNKKLADSKISNNKNLTGGYDFEYSKTKNNFESLNNINSKSLNINEIKQKLNSLGISASIMVKKASCHCQIHIGINQIKIKDFYTETSTDLHSKYLTLTRLLNEYFNGDLKFTGWRCQNPYYKSQFKYVEISNEVYDFETLFLKCKSQINFKKFKNLTVGYNFESLNVKNTKLNIKILESTSRDMTLFKQLWIFFNTEAKLNRLKSISDYNDLPFKMYGEICKKFNKFNLKSSNQQILYIARNAYSKIIDNFVIPSTYSEAQRNYSRLKRFINKMRRINGLEKMSPQLKYKYKSESLKSLSDQLSNILLGPFDYGSNTFELDLKEALNHLAFFKSEILNSFLKFKNIKNFADGKDFKFASFESFKKLNELKFKSFKMNQFDSLINNLKSFNTLNYINETLNNKNTNLNILNCIFKSEGLNDAIFKTNFNTLNCKKLTGGCNFEVLKLNFEKLFSAYSNIINIFYRKMNDFEYSTRILPDLELVPKNNTYFRNFSSKIAS